MAGGVDWVQVRERDLDGAALLALVDLLSRAARDAAQRAGRAVRILVNRRADVALASNADGVHLGFDALDVTTLRSLLGVDALVGVSIHSPAEAREARIAGADYVHLAPVFPPISKGPSRSPLGARALAAAAASSPPILAQGGVDAGNAAALLAAGAAGVAVTGAIQGADDPARAARDLRRALDAAVRRSGF